MGHYKGWTAAALIFGVSEVVLELLMPMLMSAIVDGGLYREDTFMLQGWFSPELIANRNRFVLTVGAIMQPIADRFRISREKLAFLIDATAAPVCIIAPISAWAAATSSRAEAVGVSSRAVACTGLGVLRP